MPFQLAQKLNPKLLFPCELSLLLGQGSIKGQSQLQMKPASWPRESANTGAPFPFTHPSHSSLSPSVPSPLQLSSLWIGEPDALPVEVSMALLPSSALRLLHSVHPTLMYGPLSGPSSHHFLSTADSLGSPPLEGLLLFSDWTF